MKPGKTRRIVAFDFDDTLAETSSLIGVRFDKPEFNFEDFLDRRFRRFFGRLDIVFKSYNLTYLYSR